LWLAQPALANQNEEEETDLPAERDDLVEDLAAA